MRITIEVPDNTTRIMYTEADEGEYESDPRNVTMGMILKVEPSEESSRGVNR